MERFSSRSDVEEDGCPICLSDSSVMVHGPCHHSFCLPCMERVVNASGEEVRWPPQSMSDIHLSAPTLGRCPICRSTLSLFEVCDEKSGNLLVPPNFDYFKEQSSPLRRAVYMPYRGRVGQLSFHWDWERLRKNINNFPFLNITRSLQSNPERWRLANGKLASKLVFFDPATCHFHSESRTFHGTIRWPSRLQGSYEWDVVLGFHPSYRFLSSGRVYMKRDWHNLATSSSFLESPNIDDPYLSTTGSSKTRIDKAMRGYPLDGIWSITWLSMKSNTEQRAQIKIVSNAYTQSGYTFHLDFSGDDPSQPKISWPRSTHYQKALKGYIDFERNPLGVPLGGKIVWMPTSPGFSEISWTRETVGKLPIPTVILFGMGQDKFLYQRWEENVESEGNEIDSGIPKYHSESLWGNIFCKRLCLGSASYHFISPEHSYVSYEHPACSDLPPLDDGTPLPTRVPFSNMEFDENERKLTAQVEWENQFGTSWNDNVRWKLEMWFDSEYMVIIKGGIQCEWCKERRARARPPRPINPNRPAPVAVYVPPEDSEDLDEEDTEENNKEEQKEASDHPPQQRNEEWIMSGYGHDQVYINAAIVERYRQNDLSVVWNDIAKFQTKRLKQEKATDRSIEFVQHVFDLVESNPTSNPIDFLL